MASSADAQATAETRDRGKAQGLSSTVIAIAMLFAIGVALRFWDLGHRALHHDESLHAYYSWRFAELFTYEHNPLMHGPFQFHAIASVFTIFGDSDYTVRIAAATFGSALIVMPYFLRDYLTRPGAVIASLFIALSPTLLYFSRFARGDMFVAVFTLGMVLCIWRYLANPRLVYLGGLALCLGLSFATKETTFITALIFIAYLNVMAGIELWKDRVTESSSRPRRLAQATLLIVFAWAVVSVRPVLNRLRGAGDSRPLPAAAAPLLVMGLLTAPQFAAAAQVPLRAAGVDLARQWTTFYGSAMTTEVYLGIAGVAFLLLATFAVGLSWNPRAWVVAAAAFYLPYILLFTTLGTEQDGFASGIWGSLDYWLDQQDVRRGNQPWFYYLMTVPIYEFLSLVLAIPAAIVAIRRGDPFRRFLLFWLAATLVALSIAGEKMPWLTVHLALPLALLAASYLGPLLAELGSRLARARPFEVAWPVAAVIAAVVLLGFSLRSSLVASFEHSDEPYELLVYVQTTQELVNIADEIGAEAERSGLGLEVPIIVDSRDGFTWPWAWYLRDYANVGFIELSDDYQPAPGSIVLANAGNAENFDSSAYDRQVRYQHRAWFPEAYKSVPATDFLASIFDGGTMSRWLNFFFYRDFDLEIGHIDGIAMFPADYSAVAAPE
ncbi:MAG: TIGR03663 family protein [Dehalococcoidia bacterium]|nr:TIGR03663 family protein [Dehalococcoidia bacterium]